MAGPLVDLLPWLCVLPPAAGALLAPPLARAHRGLPSALGLAASLASLIAAVLMLSQVGLGAPVELRVPWLWAPGMPLCLLLDPLSLLMALVVAFVGTLIMAYSVSYMRDEPGQGRYWALMCLFLASMLLLVLAGDLITLLVGWKLVGFCSYALISHYYTDERERWVGGPSPEPMYPPSHCGLKALLTVFTGDVMMFSAVFIIYAYAGTFQLTALYESAWRWLPALASTPGMLALTSVLLMCGPLSKSAQFPFHEWLPEAMAGPTPVSALIHAATMVKAGVFVVARFLPIFYVGLHGLGLWEAGIFFLLAAYLGAITAFLGAAQGCVASELKKALAYSTMSQIGYLMLGLGASGLLAEPATGVAATFYHLMAHALFKSALFMMAGIAIHVAGTIYMEQMGGLRRRLPITWALTLLLALALIGVPPLSGFWGKEAIMSAGLDAGLLAPFALALLTVPLTAFYTIRMVGMVFHGRASARTHDEGEASPALLAPMAILTAGTVGLGLAAPLMLAPLSAKFDVMLSAYLGRIGHASVSPEGLVQHLPSLALSLALMALSGWAAYALYVRGTPSPEALLASRPWLKRLRTLLRARLGINGAYYAISNAFLRARGPVRGAEGAMDGALNVGLPRAFRRLASAIRRVQTGHLGYNLAYMACALTAILLLIVLGVM